MCWNQKHTHQNEIEIHTSGIKDINVLKTCTLCLSFYSSFILQDLFRIYCIKSRHIFHQKKWYNIHQMVNNIHQPMKTKIYVKESSGTAAVCPGVFLCM